MKAALLQLNVTDDPVANLVQTQSFVEEAAQEGAGFILTPEVTNCISLNRDHQEKVLFHQQDDPTLDALRKMAVIKGVWLSIGSLAVKTDDPDGRFANRSFLIDPAGNIVAQYDKIHMFDVTVSATEKYRESAGYRPGDAAVVADTPFAKLGLSICYDLRFAYLYRALAQAGAEVLLVPSAFSPATGVAHWESLLRARAIETGCYVLAAAQTGQHAAQTGKSRQTYGHSLAVSPWGEVLLDMGEQPGVGYVELDMATVAESRRKIAALCHDRPFKGP